MAKWNTKRKPFIPDMETPKTYECKVCGSKIIPRITDKYVVKDRVSSGGLASAMNGSYAEPELFDAFDCKTCGCQFIAKKRLRVVGE